jgi:endonuclease/exonuclease/phosphatase family metal-dependent hydrolase
VQQVNNECTNKSENKLKVMTYNIWNLNKGKDFEYLDRVDMITEQILSLNIDVVAFQEVRISNFEYPSKRYSL